jgi:hypothetical protein
MRRSTISRSEYFQLIGLLVLAKRYNAMLTELVVAARAITGETDEMGHTADGVYCDYTADAIMEKLGIQIEGPPPAVVDAGEGQ